jgi:hypothetical protein
MTYLAERIRAIHADTTRKNIDDLLRIAIQVQRLEVAMDELVGEAKVAEMRLPRWRRMAQL